MTESVRNVLSADHQFKFESHEDGRLIAQRLGNNGQWDVIREWPKTAPIARLFEIAWDRWVDVEAHREDYSKLLDEKRGLQERLNETKAELAKSQEEKAALGAAIDIANGDVSRLQAELQKQTAAQEGAV